MLDVSANGLRDEIRAAEQWRSDLLQHFDDDVDRYHGPYFKSSKGGPLGAGIADPENTIYEWISLIVPQMVFGNPAVKIGSRRVNDQKERARALQFATNRWIKQTNMRRLNEKLAVDFAFNFTICMTTRAPMPGQSEYEDPAMWPSCVRIPQRRFVFDPLGLEPELWRWSGHEVVRDKDSILMEAKDDDSWITEAVEAIEAGHISDDIRDKDAGRRQTPVREEVAYYEVWVPESDATELDDEGAENFTPQNGYHGVIYTIARDGDSMQYIRKPRPYWGPRWGPYTFIGAHVIPDEATPLSPITATRLQAEDLNNHARAAGNAARRFKQLTFVDAMDPDMIQKAQSEKDGFVVAVDGLDRSKVVTSQFGGAHPTQIDYMSVVRDRYNRVSGIDDAQRGNVESNTTATANAIADRASNTRTGFFVQKFRDGITRVLQTVAWYLDLDDEVRFPLGEEAEGKFFHPMTGLPIEDPIYVGGLSDEEKVHYRHEDLELEIEPYSMSRTSEATLQRRMLEISNIVLNTAPLIPQTPWIDWKLYFQRIGEMANIPDIDQFIDVDLAVQFGARQMQMEEIALQSDTAKPQLNRSAGGGGSQGVMPRAAQSSGLASLMRNGSGDSDGYSAGTTVGVTART